MIQTYSVAQMRRAESLADSQYGISLSAMMNRAGCGLAQTALTMLGGHRGPIAVLCGSGNNGGDGYVCATELHNLGVPVEVWAVDRAGLGPGTLARAAAGSCADAGVLIHDASKSFTPDQLASAALIIDALLGTGMARPVTGLFANLIDVVNATECPVLSCDVPSGVDADSGAILGSAIKATKTLMMGLAKPACDLPPGAEHFGELVVCDIGLPPALVADL